MYNEQCTCIPCPKVAPHSSTSSLTCCEENRRWWGVHSVSQHIYLHCTSAYLTKNFTVYTIYIYLTITIPHILHYFTQLLYTKQETTIPRHCSSIYIKSFCTASHNACFLAYKWTFKHPNWWLIGTACFLFWNFLQFGQYILVNSFTSGSTTT